ncbi:Hint domain-containing protein [Litoreibacter sp.]|nr:Hint domain-containing protein [Litoreibacter sp.]
MTDTKKMTGLLGGCNVLTMQGYVPIADLNVGDRIITRNGLRVLRELSVTAHTFRAISVGKGTLGYSRPTTEMLMAPDQEVMVRDWRAEVLFGRDAVIIPIARMVDGKYISEEATLSEHNVFELRFDGEEVYYADGVEIISKLTVASFEEVDVAQAA